MIKNSNGNHNNHNNNNSHNIKLKLKILPDYKRCIYIVTNVINIHVIHFQKNNLNFKKKKDQRKIEMCYLFD